MDESKNHYAAIKKLNKKEMHAVYADIENATVLEMGCSIKKNDVIKDLIAFKNLSNVEVVVTDMASGYAPGVTTWPFSFPTVFFGVSFHIVSKVPL